MPPGGLPQPGKLVVNLPNHHLQYAVTWYGLALVLVVVFAVWAFASSARRPPLAAVDDRSTRGSRVPCESRLFY